jgi:hypothetical protein
MDNEPQGFTAQVGSIFSHPVKNNMDFVVLLLVFGIFAVIFWAVFDGTKILEKGLSS